MTLKFRFKLAKICIIHNANFIIALVNFLSDHLKLCSFELVRVSGLGFDGNGYRSWDVFWLIFNRRKRSAYVDCQKLTCAL